MADSEAVAKIIKAGGEATQTVANLGRETRKTVGDLADLEARIERTARKREALQQRVSKGELTPMSPEVRGVATELASLRTQYARQVPAGVYRAPGAGAAPSVGGRRPSPAELGAMSTAEINARAAQLVTASKATLARIQQQVAAGVTIGGEGPAIPAATRAAAVRAGVTPAELTRSHELRPGTLIIPQAESQRPPTPPSAQAAVDTHRPPPPVQAAAAVQVDKWAIIDPGGKGADAAWGPPPIKTPPPVASPAPPEGEDAPRRTAGGQISISGMSPQHTKTGGHGTIRASEAYAWAQVPAEQLQSYADAPDTPDDARAAIREEIERRQRAATPAATMTSAGGNYTAEELARSKELKPGTLLIMPPEMKKSTAPQAAMPRGSLLLGQGLMPGVRTATQVKEDADVDRELEKRTALQRKLAAEERYSSLSNKDLRKEWSQTQTDLKGVGRDLDKTIDQYQRLRTVQTPHAADERARLLLKRRDLAQTEESYKAQQEAMRKTAESRGMRVVGGQMLGGDGGGGHKALQALMGGIGLGEGGFTGMLTGTLMGSLGLMTGIAGAIGLAIGKSIEMGREGYRKRVEVLHEELPIATMLGRTPESAESMMVETTRQSRASNIFLPQEVRGAEAVRARGLGTLDTRGVITAATLSGRGLSEQAQVDVALGASGRQLDVDASLRAMAEYRQSAMAPRVRNSRMGVAFNFLPQFESLVPSLLQSESSPFTRADEPTALAQAAAASHLDLGIESPLGRGQAGVALLAGRNRMLSGFGAGNDPIAQLSVLAMRKLSETKDAAWKARLKKATGGVDIDTLPGKLELIQRAPELEAQFPELGEGIFDTLHDYYPDQGTMAMALLGKAGGNWTLARKASTRELDRAARARPTPITKSGIDTETESALVAQRRKFFGGAGPASDQAPSFTEQATAAAAAVQESAPAKVYGQYAVIPEAQTLEMGHAIGESIGDRIMPMMNALPQLLVDTLTKILVREEVPGSSPAP